MCISIIISVSHYCSPCVYIFMSYESYFRVVQDPFGIPYSLLHGLTVWVRRDPILLAIKCLLFQWKTVQIAVLSCVHPSIPPSSVAPLSQLSGDRSERSRLIVTSTYGGAVF